MNLHIAKHQSTNSWQVWNYSTLPGKWLASFADKAEAAQYVAAKTAAAERAHAAAGFPGETVDLAKGPLGAGPAPM